MPNAHFRLTGGYLLNQLLILHEQCVMCISFYNCDHFSLLEGRDMGLAYVCELCEGRGVKGERKEKKAEMLTYKQEVEEEL